MTERNLQKELHAIVLAEPDWDTVYGTIEKDDMNEPDWEEQGDTFIPIAYCITMEVDTIGGENISVRKWVAPPADEEGEVNIVTTGDWWEFVLTDVYCMLREAFA